VASKCRVITRFRNTQGLPGRMGVRLQPNHPTDDARGIAAAMLDGLLYGAGDAVIGINPASDSPEAIHTMLAMMDEVRQRYAIPTQSCVLTHVTSTLELISAARRWIWYSSRLPVPKSQRLRHQSGGAGRSATGRAGAAPRHGGRQCDVFRNRPGQRAVANAHWGWTSKPAKCAPMPWHGISHPCW
jgi:ethanolamine ammonia-lyase large subunit